LFNENLLFSNIIVFFTSLNGTMNGSSTILLKV